MDDLALAVSELWLSRLPWLIAGGSVYSDGLRNTHYLSPCSLVLLAFSMGCPMFVCSMTQVEITIKLNSLDLLVFLLIPAFAKSKAKGRALQVVTWWQVVLPDKWSRAGVRPLGTEEWWRSGELMAHPGVWGGSCSARPCQGPVLPPLWMGQCCQNLKWWLPCFKHFFVFVF